MNQLVLSLALLVVAFVGFNAANDFDPLTVRLLDYQNSPDARELYHMNALFRSNIPERNGEFVYDELIAAMQDAAMRDAKMILPMENFYIIDVSLLKSDDDHLTIEQTFWRQNRNLGELISVPIYGEDLNPADVSSREITVKSENLDWMDDDLPALVQQLHDLLMDFTQTRNTYIFVHCQHGHDRAGEVSGAYWIAKGFKSWEQVSASNYQIADGHITYANQRALTWYCHHLSLHSDYTGLTCTHENLDSSTAAVPVLLGWDISETVSRKWPAIVFPILGSLVLVGLCFCLLAVVVGVLVSARRANLWKSSSPPSLDVELELRDGLDSEDV